MAAPPPHDKQEDVSAPTIQKLGLGPALRAGFLVALVLSSWSFATTGTGGTLWTLAMTWAIASLGAYPWLVQGTVHPSHRAVALGTAIGALSGLLVALIRGGPIRGVILYGLAGSAAGWVAAVREWCPDFADSSRERAVSRAITEPLVRRLAQRTGILRALLDEPPREWLKGLAHRSADHKKTSLGSHLLLAPILGGCLAVLAVVTAVSLLTPARLTWGLAEMAVAILYGSGDAGMLLSVQRSGDISFVQLFATLCSGTAAIILTCGTLFAWVIWQQRHEQPDRQSQGGSVALGGGITLSWYLFPLLYNWCFCSLSRVPFPSVWGFMVPAIQNADFAHSGGNAALHRDWRLVEWPSYAIAAAVVFTAGQVVVLAAIAAYRGSIRGFVTRLLNQAGQSLTKAEAEWHYSAAGKTVGPVSSQQLRLLVADGVIKQDDLVWRKGSREWIAASRVRGLCGDARMPPPIPGEAGESAPSASAPSLPLGIHMQRMGVIASCAVGAMGTFMPWATAPVVGTMYGTAGDGWITLSLFACAIACVTIGNREFSVARVQHWAAIIFAGLAGAVAASKLVGLYVRKAEMRRDNGGNPFGEAMLQAFQVGPGLYVIVLAALAAVCCAVWLREDDSLA